MKIGIRKPSFKRSFKARTTARAKRAIKRALIPGYGKKGAGWVKDPKKALYNKIYNKTTIGASLGDMQRNRGIYSNKFLKGLFLLITSPIWFPFYLIYLILKFLF